MTHNEAVELGLKSGAKCDMTVAHRLRLVACDYTINERGRHYDDFFTFAGEPAEVVVEGKTSTSIPMHVFHF